MQGIPRKSNRVSKDLSYALPAVCLVFVHEARGAELMAKQTTVTIETSSLLILRSRNTKGAWCPQCGCEVEAIDLSCDEVSALALWFNPRDVHRFEAPNGSALLCLNSLLARVQTKSATRGFPRLPNSEKERI